MIRTKVPTWTVFGAASFPTFVHGLTLDRWSLTVKRMNELPTMTTEEICFAREALEKSTREMALLLGVTQRTYQRWEVGDREIPGPAVLLLKRILYDHEKLNKKSFRGVDR